MSIQAYLFRWGAGKSDAKRDAAIPLPEGVVSHLDIPYGPDGKWNLLDQNKMCHGLCIPVKLKMIFSLFQNYLV